MDVVDVDCMNALLQECLGFKGCLNLTWFKKSLAFYQAAAPPFSWCWMFCSSHYYYIIDTYSKFFSGQTCVIDLYLLA